MAIACLSAAVRTIKKREIKSGIRAEGVVVHAVGFLGRNPDSSRKRILGINEGLCRRIPLVRAFPVATGISEMLVVFTKGTANFR